MLWIKNLEFGYSTWKRSREIAKAYGPERHLPKVKPKTALVIFASCAACAVLYFAIPSIINAGRFLQKMQLQAKEKNGSPKPVVSAKDSKGQEASPTEKAGCPIFGCIGIRSRASAFFKHPGDRHFQDFNKKHHDFQGNDLLPFGK